ncbi:hypothetical protein MHTCC0001_31040 [Flavobacteriaceae bacterium MHTCC 0001]
MKTKLLILSLGLFMITGVSYAQKISLDKTSIIKPPHIKQYYDKDQLSRMRKGELLVLYDQRIKTLIQTLPYIAFATKPGVSLASLGIPKDNSNAKALEAQFEATDDYLEKTKEFHDRILPYSDTDDLIAAILFYEETLKALHTYSEFH